MTVGGTLLRWGDGRRASSGLARERILDAAWRCYQRHSVQKTRMEQIAREAKVSRTTIYRYFQNREELLNGVVLRTVYDLMALIEGRVNRNAQFAEFLIESLAITTEIVQQSSIFTTLLEEPGIIMSHSYIGSSEVFNAMCNYFRPHFDAAKAADQLRDNIEFEPLMDWIIHIVEAYILTPSPLYLERGLRKMLSHFLVPVIVREPVISMIN